MNYDKFKNKLGSWGDKLRPFIESEECDKIYAFLKAEALRGRKICPMADETYRAFQTTPYGKLKVVFLLQDPYPWIKDGNYVADGIAMSCSHSSHLQPSLKLFYDGIEEDLYNGLNLNFIRHNDLAYLCDQGVMMLNTALTVEANKVGSHRQLWKPFTQYLLEEVFSKHENGLIFVLAGEASQYYERFINPLQHHIIKVEHPAAAAHKDRKWDHKKIFSLINKVLAESGKSVHWIYEEAPF